MPTHQEQLHIETSGHRDMHDLTAEVAAVVTRSKILMGTVHIFNVGSTGAIGTLEYEPGLERDLPARLDPPQADSQKAGTQ